MSCCGADTMWCRGVTSFVRELLEAAGPCLCPLPMFGAIAVRGCSDSHGSSLTPQQHQSVHQGSWGGSREREQAGQCKESRSGLHSFWLAPSAHWQLHTCPFTWAHVSARTMFLYCSLSTAATFSFKLNMSWPWCNAAAGVFIPVYGSSYALFSLWN